MAKEWVQPMKSGRNMAMMAEGLKRSSETVDVRQSPIYQEVLAQLGDERTVLDIGAGVGRFTGPLANAGCSVTAVEPSAEMLPYLLEAIKSSNASERVRVVQSTWPLSEPVRVEVALAAFVIQFSEDYGQFARAMEHAASRRCILAVHVDPIMGFLVPLWPIFRPDEPAPHMPDFADIYPALLRQGILGDVRIFSESHGPRWSDPAQAIPMIAGRLGIQDDPVAMDKLHRVLEAQKEEMMAPRLHRAAIISWTPPKA